MSTFSIFKANPNQGIVTARMIHFYRKPETGLYGITDEDIYKRGFLNFNYHPDQWGGQSNYTHGFPGTKVNGLPIRLMTDIDEATSRISEGKLFPASSMRSKIDGKNDGAILLANFSLEQIRKMGLGFNAIFDMRKGQQTSTLLTPEVKDDSLLLRIKDLNDLTKIDPGLKTRFNSEGYLIGNAGEFYIPEMLPIEEYRDKLLVFRPDKEGDGFHHQYLARDIEIRKEGIEGKLGQFLP